MSVLNINMLLLQLLETHDLFRFLLISPVKIPSLLPQTVESNTSFFILQISCLFVQVCVNIPPCSKKKRLNKCYFLNNFCLTEIISQNCVRSCRFTQSVFESGRFICMLKCRNREQFLLYTFVNLQFDSLCFRNFLN